MLLYSLAALVRFRAPHGRAFEHKLRMCSDEAVQGSAKADANLTELLMSIT